MEVCGQLQLAATYLQGKILLYPLYRRLGGLESCSGCGAKEKSLCPYQKSHHSYLAHS
jgi:hypothetical protein